MNQISTHPELADAKVRLGSELDQLVQLRPMPAVATQIMKACENEEADVRSLVQLVECDAAISSRILSVVNSSMFGYSREVASINQAVVVLGMSKLSQLAVSVASEGIFSEGSAGKEGRMRLYSHSLGCAAIARLLAESGHGDVDSGEAFLAAMLHDVGKLVFFDVAPVHYTALQDAETKECSIDIEQEVFGTDHTLLGQKFGDIWGLPAQISHAIGNHHQAFDESSDPLSRITALANGLAKNWGLGQAPVDDDCPIVTTWLEGVSQESLEELQADATEHFAELKSLLSN